MSDTGAPNAVKSYRKKPVVIQAVKLDLSDAEGSRAVAAWCNGWIEKDRLTAQFPNSLNIQTLEGIMTARSGDYIIQGVKGEFYPCKPDIFTATYEPTSAIPVFKATGRPELGTKNYSIDAVGREGGKASTETQG